MIDELKNWWIETIYEISPQYRTYIPGKRNGLISLLKFSLICAFFICLFLFLFIKKGLWLVLFAGLFFSIKQLFMRHSYFPKEVDLRFGKKLVKDKSRKFYFSKEQRNISIQLSISKIILTCIMFMMGMYYMSLPETQVKFISEEDLSLVLSKGDTLYARGNIVDISYREAENTYILKDHKRKRIRYNYFYRDAYSTNSFIIGIYQRLNFIGYQDSLSRKFFAIKPLHEHSFKYKSKYANDSLFETVLDDSFLFVEPFQVTISPEHYSRLVKEGKKWDFRWL